MSDRRLARYVQPQLSEARIARQWSEAGPRSLRRGMPRHLAPALLLGAVLVASFVLFVRARSRAAPGSLEGAILEGGDVVLPEGSHIGVEPGGRVRLGAVRADRVELAVVEGAVNLAVPHGKRTVVIHAGPFDVVDLGTRFRVALGPGGDVSVSVAEGSVEVESRDGATPGRTLSAGDAWSSAPPSPPAPAPVAEETPPAATDPAPAEIAPPGSSPEAGAGPKELLEVAARARVAGRPQAAASALDALRRHYRRDPRAALAAFELGRLRLDSLRDAAGAVEALSDAISLAPNGPLREDAEARRVEALAVERSPECAAARDGFLARYPRSVHAAVVAGRCGSD